MKRMVGTAELKVGHMLFEFMTPNIGNLLRGAGADFGIIDMEHNGLGFETLATTIRYLHAAGLPAVSRIATREPIDVARALDVGADCVMVPLVSSVEQARRLIDALKYFPAGKRGIALPPLQRYAPRPMHEAMIAANNDTALFVQIENAVGVSCVDELASLEAVDCLWVGHADLSSDLGIPGQFDHPRFQEAEAAVIAAAKNHGKSLGRLSHLVDEGEALYRKGYDMIAFSNDLKLMETALKAGSDALRARCA
jgi:2-dehydro-3-deoxyglucarate aldolase/4-hydroxy-2-oxoheptanedioate aldolase